MPLTKIRDAAITTMLILVLSAIAQPARSDDDVGKKTATPPRTEGRNTAPSVDGDALANGLSLTVEIQLRQLREELKAQQETLREQQQELLPSRPSFG